MERVGLRGYYRMKAINECEATGRRRIVCLRVCIIHVSQSMEPISSGPPSPVESLIKSPCWGFRLLPEGSASLHMSCLNTWPAKVKIRFESSWTSHEHSVWLFEVCVWVCESVCCVVTLCPAKVSNKTKRESEDITWQRRYFSSLSVLLFCQVMWWFVKSSQVYWYGTQLKKNTHGNIIWQNNLDLTSTFLRAHQKMLIVTLWRVWELRRLEWSLFYQY